MTRSIIPICTGILAGALLSYAQQPYQEDQQAADMTGRDDETQAPMINGRPLAMVKSDDNGDEDTHVRDFDAEAAAIVNALCDKMSYSCIRSKDGRAVNVTFAPREGEGQPETCFEYDIDYIAQQLREGGEEEEDGEEVPGSSYLGRDGEEISEEEYERLVEVERKHEREGTLHLLYPEVYEEGYREWYDRLDEDGDEEDTHYKGAADEDLAEASLRRENARDQSEGEIEQLATDSLHEVL